MVSGLSWLPRQRGGTREKHQHIISVFGPRPYANALVHLHIVNHPNPRSLLIPGKTPEFEPLLYFGFCNKYAIHHEHDCDDYSPTGPYDGYPSDAPSTD